MKAWFVAILACLGCHSEPIDPPKAEPQAMVEPAPKVPHPEAESAWETAKGMIIDALQNGNAVYQVEFGNQTADETVEAVGSGVRISGVAFCKSPAGTVTERRFTCGLTLKNGDWRLDGITLY